jgi:predicted PurR-regulated permease PerM
MGFLNITTYYLYAAPTLMLEKFNMNMYINGFAFGISEIVSYPFSYYFSKKVPRKSAFMVALVFIFILTIPVFFTKNSVCKEG